MITTIFLPVLNFRRQRLQGTCERRNGDTKWHLILQHFFHVVYVRLRVHSGTLCTCHSQACQWTIWPTSFNLDSLSTIFFCCWFADSTCHFYSCILGSLLSFYLYQNYLMNYPKFFNFRPVNYKLPLFFPPETKQCSHHVVASAVSQNLLLKIVS